MRARPAPGRAARAAGPEPMRPVAFGRSRTRREAHLKGTGTGTGAPPLPSGWTVRDVLVGPRHSAATALAGVAEPLITLRSLPVACLFDGAAGLPLSAAPPCGPEKERFMDASVVVVGAGPAGLMLAGELRLAGADVTVLERHRARTGEPRGSA